MQAVLVPGTEEMEGEDLKTWGGLGSSDRGRASSVGRRTDCNWAGLCQELGLARPSETRQLKKLLVRTLLSAG